MELAIVNKSCSSSYLHSQQAPHSKWVVLIGPKFAPSSGMLRVDEEVCFQPEVTYKRLFYKL